MLGPALLAGLPGAAQFLDGAVAADGVPYRDGAGRSCCNALGDYALIFGHFGFPKLGLMGSGIASACSYGFSFFAMVAVIWLTPKTERSPHFPPLPLSPLGQADRGLSAGDAPIGLTMIFEAMLFNSATLIAWGRSGTASVAAHQRSAMIIPSITFMVPLGIGMAATVRVGTAQAHAIPRPRNAPAMWR